MTQEHKQSNKNRTFATWNADFPISVRDIYIKQTDY